MFINKADYQDIITLTSHCYPLLVVLFLLPVSLSARQCEASPPIIFRAAAFPVLPSASAEDLLRRLPGIRVDAAGAITLNGNPVNHILVNGKESFGSDPGMALRFLRAGMIDQIVVREDSIQADFVPGLNIWQAEVLLDIQLKDDFRTGWRATVLAGAGSGVDKLRQPSEAGGRLDLLRKAVQVSVVGERSTLSQNSLVMTDLLQTGGFQRTLDAMPPSGQGGWVPNAVVAGGAAQGSQRTWNSGICLGYRPGKKLGLTVCYLGRNQRRNDTIETLSERFIENRMIRSRSQTIGDYAGENHTLDLKLSWNPDSLTRIVLMPSLQVNGLSGISVNTAETRLDTTLYNQFFGFIRGTSWEVGLQSQALVERRFVKPGRMLTLVNQTGLYQLGGLPTTGAHIVFDVADSLFFFQDQSNLLKTVRSFSRISWQEPLSPTLLWTVSLSNTTVLMQDSAETIDKYLMFPSGKRIDSLSGSFRMSYRARQVSTSLIWTTGKGRQAFSVQPVFSLQSLHFQSHYSSGEQFQPQYTTFLPGLRISCGNFRAGYEMLTRDLSDRELQPAVNNVNPLNLVRQNTRLEPLLLHRFQLVFSAINPLKNTHFTTGIRGEFFQMGIGTERSIDNNGISVARLVNAKGIADGSAWGRYGFPVTQKGAWVVRAETGAWLGFARRVISFGGISAAPMRYDANADVRLEADWKDRLEVSGWYRLARTFNTFNTPAYQDSSVVWQTATAQASLQVFRRMRCSAEGVYRRTATPTPGFRQSVTLINAGATFFLFRGNRGQLRIFAHDLLNQNQAISKVFVTNEIVNQSASLQRRYLLLTFIYTLGL